jgi:dihydroorotate dehydrogenase electron transfer subunit
MRRDERATLVDRRELSPDASLLYNRSEFLASNMLPGQFTMVRLPEAEGLLLRRPYSFCDAEPARPDSPDGGRFSLLVKEVGRGTRALARLPVGAELDCLGPLGSTFAMPAENRRPVIVAGGVGIAPFVAFCRALRAADRTATVLLGGRTEHDLYLREEFDALGMDVVCSTEDGSFGEKGRVTVLLDDTLDGDVQLYSCGPTPMLVKVADAARERGVPHQVSLERRMGCGMGCCLGCVVYTSEYVRCCTEGPVFDADTIQWERDVNPL